MNVFRALGNFMVSFSFSVCRPHSFIPSSSCSASLVPLLVLFLLFGWSLSGTRKETTVKLIVKSDDGVNGDGRRVSDEVN
ncbi:hypothetical protein E2C01_015075 [Portunus trituberculatus]|uniref:Uncharacterized protein n=1 Tax=Portunus trituberculatus TaxID=210409 RepID=A0A5B7DLV5_PORTR|nr:hypothetical protein [Portunus trituberculatus]